MARTVEPDYRHVAYLEALKDALKTVPNVPSDQILAVASQYIGMLLALQDMRTMTPQKGLELIMRNIEIGNMMAVKNAPVAGRS